LFTRRETEAPGISRKIAKVSALRHRNNRGRHGIRQFSHLSNSSTSYIGSACSAEQRSAALSPDSIASKQTYSVARTFLRAARRAYLGAGDFTVIGVPFDCASSNRPGARLGPEAIRSASAQLADLKVYPGGFNPLGHVHVMDVGDMLLDFGFPATIPSAITDQSSKVIETGRLFVRARRRSLR
jgi:hypothetical protein